VVRRLRDCLDLDCGTGFSREDVTRYTANLMAFTPASSRLKPVLLDAACSQWNWLKCRLRDCLDLDCGTGFSRESVRRHTANLMSIIPASSRLKPVPLNTACSQWDRVERRLWDCLDLDCGTGFSRESVRRHSAKPEPNSSPITPC